MKKIKHPLISCICVTRGRPFFLKRAIKCFLSQTYSNKELVVVYDDDDFLTEKVLKLMAYSNVNIYKVNRTKEVTLGYLRNYAIARADGEYICQWDDDDWHHPVRMEYQYEVTLAKKKSGCVMTQWLIYNSFTQEVFVSHKRLWEGSLLIKTNLISDVGYDNYDRGEDTSAVERLYKEDKLCLVNETPNLYVYTYHKENTWTPDHWEKIFRKSYRLSPVDSKEIEEILSCPKDIVEQSIRIDNVIDNPLLEEEDNVDISYRIPKKIHLTYKDKSLPESYQNFYDRLKLLHPEWEIKIYDDTDMVNLVKEHFPDLFEIFVNYPTTVQRTDIFRILIVYLKGGFYLDIDMYCLKSLDNLCRFNLVLGEERTISHLEIEKWNPINGLQVANYMFGSIEGHPFWLEVLLEGIKRSSNNIKCENDILISTGPWLISEVFHNTKNKYNDITLLRNKFRLCLNHCETVSCRFGEYAVHFHSGTWKWQETGNQLVKPRNVFKEVNRQVIDRAYKNILKKLRPFKN